MSQNTRMMLIGAACLVVILGFSGQLVEAGQGCPFDDGSCQEYCNQQGCNMGYCGHFAWIQCICRKCGDEWSWYDKVRYNPDKTVNQTELDSLKLNGTTTLILTNGEQQQQHQQKQLAQPTEVAATNQQQQQQQQQLKANNSGQAAATLTTLLIPDLSDTSGKLDLNDIPDENSDKFLDYLAKNHEKLVEATANSAKQQLSETDDDEIGEEQTQQQASTTTTTTISPGNIGQDEEIIEIQISSNNNNNNNTSNEPTTSAPQQQQQQQQVSSTEASPATSSQPEPKQQQPQAQKHSPITRLLRMAVIERASDEID